MNTKSILRFISVVVLGLILTGCQAMKEANKPFKHNTPLIKENIKKDGRAEIQKTLELGPKPATGKKVYGKRKKISSEAQRNYLLIPDTFPALKQRVTFKFKNLDFKETMILMGKIGEINVLVGDEVAGAISAELVDVPWDKAFQALLDMKNYASDIDVGSNLIRVHSPDTLTAQENYKSDRAQAVKRKVELEDSVEPIISEIFRLYYITPAQAKATIEELFTQRSGDNTYIPIQVTEEKTTRSIIVRGKEKDLDVVDKLMKEIDIRTKQVLIEAFIVEANSDFERALGTRLGGYYLRGGNNVGGISGSSSGSADGTDLNNVANIGSATDSVTNFAATGATSGIGILRRTGSGVLKAEITALESMGLGKTISNPKVFTLDNQSATVTQGEEIPYQTTAEGTTSTSFKEAALKLEVTPSIIGDGNVLLSIKVNNDTPNRAAESDEPPINKMEIVTKLLVADGDIVVIGGIKKNVIAQSKSQTPGIGNMPVIGNLFKGKSNSDNLDELLVFIAPRIL
ncbi:MAG: type IV pilus secretin PilQ [Proteobacteria bacterium]|jgi:type IV pilus assembly protein PilQ|nr:type IV pilus secretin PilQ [Pseudomonadota bacterium]